MPRFDTTLDVDAPTIVYTPRRVSYERRPIDGDAGIRPFTDSALTGGASFVILAALIVGMRIETRWLAVAVGVGAFVFLVTYIWRTGVRDNLVLFEREVTTDLPDERLRPTVTEGARGETVRRMNFALERKYWLALYSAHADGTPVTRDGVVKARGMPRDLYHGDAWQPTLRELRRVGLIDNENRMTDEWRRFHAEMVLRSPRSFVPTQNGGDGNGAG